MMRVVTGAGVDGCVGKDALQPHAISTAAADPPSARNRAAYAIAMISRIRRVLCLGLLSASMCNCAEQPAPSWWNTPTSPTEASLVITSLTIEPRALTAGRSTQGTLTLNEALRIPATVQLSATHPSVSIPSSVSVAPGSAGGTFPIDTTEIDRDMVVTITASVADRKYNAAFTVL